MDKVMQPKRVIKLTEAEKRIISQYTASTNENLLKPLQSVITDKKIIKWLF